MYADDLVLRGKVEEDLKVKVGCFVEVCRRRGLKVNGDVSKTMVLFGEDGLWYEVIMDGMRLETFS